MKHLPRNNVWGSSIPKVKLFAVNPKPATSRNQRNQQPTQHSFVARKTTSYRIHLEKEVEKCFNITRKLLFSVTQNASSRVLDASIKMYG